MFSMHTVRHLYHNRRQDGATNRNIMNAFDDLEQTTAYDLAQMLAKVETMSVDPGSFHSYVMRAKKKLQDDLMACDVTPSTEKGEHLLFTFQTFNTWNDLVKAYHALNPGERSDFSEVPFSPPGMFSEVDGDAHRPKQPVVLSADERRDILLIKRTIDQSMANVVVTLNKVDEWKRRARSLGVAMDASLAMNVVRELVDFYAQVSSDYDVSPLFSTLQNLRSVSAGRALTGSESDTNNGEARN